MSTGFWPRRRRMFAGGLGFVLLVVGAFLLSPLPNAFSGSDPVAPTAEPQESDGPTLPTLTLTQTQQALSIAHADPNVSALFNSPSVTTAVVPWMTLKSHELLGAGIDIEWPTPTSVSAVWPVLFYDQTETASPPYQTTTAALTVDNLTAVHVLIDLNTNSVLAIEAMPEANTTSFTLDPNFQNTLPPQPGE